MNKLTQEQAAWLIEAFRDMAINGQNFSQQMGECHFEIKAIEKIIKECTENKSKFERPYWNKESED